MLIIGRRLDAAVAKHGVNGIANSDNSAAFDNHFQLMREALALKLASLAEGYSEKALVDACASDSARSILERQGDLIRHADRT